MSLWNACNNIDINDRLEKDRRVVHRVTTRDNQWQRVTMSGTTSDKE